jgi:hypothetical protein
MAGLEPKNNSIFQNPKSQIGTVKRQNLARELKNVCNCVKSATTN